jgi:hypothetical protein
MASSQEDQFFEKKYTEPVDIFIGDDGSSDQIRITWVPGDNGGNLFGRTDSSIEASYRILDMIHQLYISSPGDYIAGSPVGPFFAGKSNDLPTVIYAINRLYQGIKIRTVGDAPTMTDFMLDESTNVDEDGNTVVR